MKAETAPAQGASGTLSKVISSFWTAWELWFSGSGQESNQDVNSSSDDDNDNDDSGQELY